jgi:hypothetical protein
MNPVNPVRPSETTDYIRCARLWKFKHLDGWQPPASAWSPQQLMGTAIHAGLANHWRVKQGLASLKPEEILIQVKDPHMAAEMALRVGWPQDAPEQYSYDVHETLVGRVLNSVLQWIDQEMPDASPVLVEESLGVDGHTTPDLVTREPLGAFSGASGGALVVTDWKTSWDVPPDRVRYRLEGAERTHQFLHYCWAVQEHLQEPVSMFRKVVIVGSPKILVKEATFQPSPEALEYWLTGARQIWHDMSRVRSGDRVAPQNVNGCKMYGDKYPCPYFEGCWTCSGNEGKMAQFYSKPRSTSPEG